MGIAGTQQRSILWCAVAGGALAGYVSTGTLNGALIGAFSAAAFYGVGSYFEHISETGGNSSFGKAIADNLRLSKTIAHGMTGGVISKLQGGRFAHGFASAGVTKAFSKTIADINIGSKFGNAALQSTAAAVVGGGVSEATGGKFGNGARTAGFGYLFNQLASKAIDLVTKVQIGYKKIGQLGGDSYHHAYVKVVGPDGQSYYIRGGPSSDGGGSGLSAVGSDASGSGSSGGVFYGDLKITDGIEAMRIETMQPDADLQTVYTSNRSFSDVVDQLRSFGNAVTRANIGYSPYSTNSNAFAHQSIEALGVPRPSASVWAPGSDSILDVGDYCYVCF